VVAVGNPGWITSQPSLSIAQWNAIHHCHRNPC
jgi:hypothetical protein